LADYTSRVKAFGCGMIYQMDPSGVFVDLLICITSRAEFQTSQTCRCRQRSTAPAPRLPSCRRTAVTAGSFPEDRCRSKSDPRRQKWSIQQFRTETPAPLTTECPWHKRWKEQGLDMDTRGAGHQAWGEGATESLNPNFTFKLTKNMLHGDSHCEWVVERKK
jgi:hypothetical protein